MSDDFEDCQMTDDDLIRRGDAYDAVRNTVSMSDALDAIAALPAVTPATSPGVTAGAVGEHVVTRLTIEPDMTKVREMLDAAEAKWLHLDTIAATIRVNTLRHGGTHEQADAFVRGEGDFVAWLSAKVAVIATTPPPALDDPRVRKLVKALKAAKVGFYELANQIDDEDYKGPLDGFVVPVVCHAKPYHEKQIANAIAYGEACSAALRDMEGV